MKCRLVAIAKNERRYLPEWIAYHLAIGISSITIYDNDSNDGTATLISALSKNLPIQYIHWSSVDRASPQRSAYNHAVKFYDNEDFIFFLDIDEFAVPWGFKDMTDFLTQIPGDVSAVVINWRCFGSSGIQNPLYEYVIKTFVKCSMECSPNNKHVKSIVRPLDVEEMFIHHALLKKGRTVGPDLADASFESEGKTQSPKYDGFQINHYQTKTFYEFSARMARGNANFPSSHPSHTRDGSIERFRQIDINSDQDMRIQNFFLRFDSIMNSMNQIIT